MKSNYKKYGSPITITSNSLRFNFSELEKIIHQQYNKYSREFSNQKLTEKNKIEKEDPTRFMPK